MVLFLQPVFQERLWGGTNLTQFGYDIPNNSTGECWAISAHKNGPNTIPVSYTHLTLPTSDLV